MITRKHIVIFSSVLLVVAIGLGAYSKLEDGKQIANESSNNSYSLNDFDLSNDVEHSIPLEKIASGGPGRDGIPPIDDPKFVDPSQSELDIKGQGILVDIGGEQRFYPYAILDWHEIVNDHIGNQEIAVTYCPLCGSAAVYDSRVNGEAVRFGVSGLLHESNLLMYDDITESLWSQSIGEAVVGVRTGTKLKRLPTQLMSISDAIEKYPNLKVLSTDTGHQRAYGTTPYQGYDENEEIFFDVSVNDTRLPAKTIMYVIPVGDSSVAFQQLKLARNSEVEKEFFGKRINASKDKSGEIIATVDGNKVNGYFEMWFSWATQHKNDGELWKLN